MTGYGKAEGVVENKKISVEVRSLNGKFLDCSLRVPGLYRQKEMLVRSKAAKEVVRGKVDISISYESLEGEQNFFINTGLLKNYYQRVVGGVKGIEYFGRKCFRNIDENA